MTLTSAAYKLVDSDGYTRRGQSGQTLWLPVGTIVSPTGTGTKPCGPGVLHGYCDPLVAGLGNPIHASIIDPRCLWVEIVGPGQWETDGLKRWTESPLKVLAEVSLPALTLEDRVAWAICLAPHPRTRAWAVRWLSGADRTARAARAAAWAAARAAEAAEATAEAAARAARAARAAAWAAARAAEAAEARAAEAAARAAARAARAARAAEAAARAAWAEAAEAAAARAAWAEAAEAAAARADGVAAFESRLMPMLARARAILAGAFPAERFDEPLEAAP